MAPRRPGRTEAWEGRPGRNTATVATAAEEWQRLASKGVIRARGGEVFKGGTLRAYERSIRLRVLPALGSESLAELGPTGRGW